MVNGRASSGQAPGSPSPRKHRRVGWRTSDILRAVALAFGLYYGLRLLHAASPVILIGFLGLLLGLSLGALADRFERYRVPRVVTAVGTVALVYGALVGGAVLLAPVIRGEVDALERTLPMAIDRIGSRIQGLTRVVGPPSDSMRTAAEPAAEGAAAPDRAGQPSDSVTAPAAPTLREEIANRLQGLGGFVGPFLTSTASAIAGIFIVTFIAIYIAVDPATYREGALHLVPFRHRQRAREVLRETTRVLQRWLVARLAAMGIIAIVTTLGLLALDVDAALALGALAGVLEFVPFIGPVLSAVPAVAIALVDGPEKALAVGALYLVIQQLENSLVTPLVMQKGLELPPILTILAQGIMGVVFGLLGVLVAEPVLAAIMVPVKMLYVQDVVGDDIEVGAGAGDGDREETVSG